MGGTVIFLSARHIIGTIQISNDDGGDASSDHGAFPEEGMKQHGVTLRLNSPMAFNKLVQL